MLIKRGLRCRENHHFFLVKALVDLIYLVRVLKRANSYFERTENLLERG